MFGARVQDLPDVAYIPDLQRPIGVSGEVWRQVKLSFMNKCASFLLQPLKDVSKRGVSIDTSLGCKVKVYPRLFSYVVDDPESKDITCIKGGSSQYPCELCMVEHSRLADLEAALAGDFGIRTEKMQRAAFKVVSSAPTQAERRTLSKQKSTHPVPSCLWGFHHQRKGYGTSTWCVGYETMHNEDLGVWETIIEGTESHLMRVHKSTSKASWINTSYLT